ncbi:ATP-binding protein [Pseudoduganella namucuonensis]|uniref:Virulence sensor protein BvgS n=1 Tax=Pseudoduganella namucuonensis TaxID=1035707 RepID=A0A1I7GVI0_9BURK|nr:ATP-binding protein [Pseudoduganella namucuonensis]SFU52415.1 PAS domain S-box-containing protein [Pseudoduganella namucuonensis]
MSAVLESITDGFLVVDPDWSISYINPQAADLLHPSDGGAVTPGQDLWSALPELCGTVLEAQFRRAMELQQPAGFELYHLPRKLWLDVRAWPSAAGLAASVQNISKRKAEERALRESANRLQVALAAGKLGDWVWDAGTSQVTLSRRAAELLELPGECVVNWDALAERLPEPDREHAAAAFARTLEKRGDFNIECRIVRPNGALCWLAVVGHGNYDDDGALLGLTGMVQDISDRKLAEGALRQSQEELQAMANSIPQLAWIARHDGAMVWYNERWYEYTGLSRDTAPAGAWDEVYDQECVPAIRQRWRESLQNGEPFEMEFPIRGADGQFRWFLSRANPVRDSAGHLLRWFGTSTDVDQVKRVQEALRDETNVLELLNSTGNAMTSQRDLRSLLQEVTDACTRISGARFGAFFYNSTGGGGDALVLYTLSGLPQDPFAHFPHPRATAIFGPSMRGEGIVRIDDLLQDPRYGKNPPYQGIPPGHPKVRSYLAVPVISRSGEVIGSLFFGHPEPEMFNERTERIIGGIAAQAGIAIDNARLYEAAQKAAEERKVLLDSERSARAEAERTSQMKDEFLATLSHELRTPLTAILGWAQVLRRGSRDEADLHRGLQTIERNARAQAQLIEDLLDMSRITSGKVLLDMQILSPLTVVDAAVETVRPAADAKNITISRDYGAGGLVAADPSRLQQVIWNLLSNAIKFTPKDGAVRITVGAGEGHITIAIADTGIGIRPEFLAHVFERFRQADSSTTRRHGGLGLGLSIVKHLVEQHGGTVAASSAGEGQGASFTVHLPLATNPPEWPRQPRPAAPPPPAAPRDAALPDLAGLRVLVVDDEADARELIKRILGDCHASVSTAASAAEALALVESLRPALLVSDIGMPEVDGFELLAKVRALGPERGGAVPAIALTAFARAEDRLRALETGFSDHVSKPVEPAELLDAVARAARNR